MTSQQVWTKDDEQSWTKTSVMNSFRRNVMTPYVSLLGYNEHEQHEKAEGTQQNNSRTKVDLSREQRERINKQQQPDVILEVTVPRSGRQPGI